MRIRRRFGIMALSAALLHMTALAGVAVGSPSSVSAFEARASTRLEQLEALSRRHSAAVAGARLEAELGRAEATQAERYSNPELDLSIQTIPLGSTNPPGLSSALTRVPAFGLGLSQTFPIGKREPRVAAARARARAAAWLVEWTVRSVAVDVARQLGALAVAMLAADSLRDAATSDARLVEALEVRVRLAASAPVDLERLRVEAARTHAALAAAESDVAAALAGCSTLLSMRCTPFPSPAEARAFVDAWVAQAEASDGAWLERPDLLALRATREAGEHEERLARAAVIPDPTLRLGFVHDRFLVSGNQMNSLDVSLSFPLPVLDQGHAQRAAASARVASAGAQERALTASAEVAASQLRLRLELAGVRQRALTEESLPLARRTLEALERASERSLVPVTDVLTAKRALAELRAAELDCLQDRFESAVSLLALTRPSGAATQGRNGR